MYEAAEVVEMARRVGIALAEQGCRVVTGACSGLPYEAARAAAGLGAEVWGFAPTATIEEQREFVPDDDLSIYSRLIFIPPTFPFNSDLLVSKKYRNILSTSHCDAGIVISGKWGTLNEVTNLIDFGKVVGILTTSGSIAGMLPGLIDVLGSEGARVVEHDDPGALVGLVMGALAGESDRGGGR
jgi:predicted Rossmann-fold nucleotide-binding protein